MLADLNAGYRLSDADRAAFARDGFIHLKRVLDPDLLRAAGETITRLTLDLNTENRAIEDRSTYDQAFLQIMNLWERSTEVARFVRNKDLARLAAELIGVDSVRLYHDQSLYKEPSGGITPAHADQYYWPMATDRTITAWIPLQPVPRDMGPLGFYRGSQTVEFGRDLNISDDSERLIRERMEAEGFEYVEEPFELGDLSFHLGWTFHRAGENRSPTPRSVMTMIYMDADARLKDVLDPVQENDRDHWCPGVAPGRLVDSPKNPVLYP